MMENIQNSAEDSTIQSAGDIKPDSENQQPKEEKAKAKTKKPSRKLLGIIFGMIIVIIGVLVAAYHLVYKPANDYAIRVGTIVVSYDEYKALKKDYVSSDEPYIKSYTNIDEFIIDTYKTRIVAEKYNIDVTTQQINEYASNYFGAASPKAWQLLAAENLMYAANIERIKEGKKQVAHVVVPFSLHFASWQDAEPGTKNPDGWGDSAIIQNDITLAKDRINKYKDSLSRDASVANAEKIVTEIKNDKTLSFGITKNQSNVFFLDKDGNIDYDETWLKMSLPKEDADLIYALDSKTSNIFTKTGNGVFSTVKGYDNDGVEIAYYFYADLGGEQDKFIYDKVTKDKENIGVKSNV